MARILRAAIFMACFLSAGSAFAAGGACPSSAPVTGNNCYFIAATGADTNSGTSESSPWLHAPGMPKCSNNCASALPASPANGNTNGAGKGIILRGGDTWHFGNSAATPYTGGPWVWQWGGNSSSCVYEGTVSGCAYIGVDTTWYNSSVCGASFCRPILNGDNPQSSCSGPGNCAYVSSCTYQIGTDNAIFEYKSSTSNYEWADYLDSLEFTGLCGGTAKSGSLLNDYIDDPQGSAGSTPIPEIQNNLYFHGWTVVSGVAAGGIYCTVLQGGGYSLWSISNMVIDGSDSYIGGCLWAYTISPYHLKDSIIRYTWDGVASLCHDIHDITFEHFVSSPSGDHSNILECNVDAGDSQFPGLTQTTPNVWYNIITRHVNSNVGEWVCPNATPEYWFNMVWYDSNSEGWDMAGTSQYASCTGTGGQWMFNNTFVDTASMLCHGSGSNVSGGVYTTSYNNHLINTPWDGAGCTGGASSSSNVSMSDATATAQGYTTGTPGTQTPNTCANETTKPCSPKSSSNGTVGAGLNVQAYCATLATYTAEHAIAVEAANACKYGTTDGCAYNATTHTMNCPAQTPVARPVSVAWDAGAYHFSGSQAQAPQPPTNLQTTVQ